MELTQQARDTRYPGIRKAEGKQLKFIFNL